MSEVEELSQNEVDEWRAYFEIKREAEERATADLERQRERDKKRQRR